MLEADASALCGPRHGRSSARTGHRWGRTRGKIDFHGGRVDVERPRVRSRGGGEVPLPTWEAAESEDWLGRWAMNLMLINVSMRRFGRAVRLPEGDVPAPLGDGRSKSAVSRRFVELSAERMAQWMAQWMASDLSELDLLAIQIDGLHIGEDLVLLAAVGIDGDGVEHPLAVIEGATENAATVQALLDNPIGRGPACTGTGTGTRRYILGPGPDERWAFVDTNGYVYSPHGDRQGTVIALSKAGSVSEQYAYDPWGQSSAPLYEQGPSSKSYAYRLTGQRLDRNTGLYDYKARDYSTALGRFLQPDPAGMGQGPNLYEYVANDPVNGRDPSGLYTCGGNSDQCGVVANALAKDADAPSKLPAGSKEQKALQGVLKFYGKAGVKNGVSISFSNKGFANETLGNGGSINITLNLGAVHAAFSQPGVNEKVETGGVLAHEGPHGMDDRARGRDVGSRSEYLQTERHAFRVQSHVNQGEGVASPYGIYRPGISPMERDQAIERAAQGATAADCAGNPVCTH